LNLNKKEKAVLDLESAKDHCDRIDNEYEISLDAVGRQLEYLRDAKDAIHDDDEDSLDKQLDNIHVSIDMEQLIFLTDKDSR